VHEKRVRPPEAATRSLKTQQSGRAEARTYGVDVDSRRARTLDGTSAIDRAGARGGWSRRIPRKEVIQPQLPLRLPCYDFTPITDSTFGRCLPCGLAHGLRVFPAFVV
jgi:hypothetical protein